MSTVSAMSSALWPVTILSHLSSFAPLRETGLLLEGLSPEDAAVRAVVLQADLADDLVHRPVVEVFVRDDGERQAVDLLVFLDGFEGVVSVA